MRAFVGATACINQHSFVFVFDSIAALDQKQCYKSVLYVICWETSMHRIIVFRESYYIVIHSLQLMFHS